MRGDVPLHSDMACTGTRLPLPLPIVLYSRKHLNNSAIVAVTNKMQLGNGIYFSTVH